MILKKISRPSRLVILIMFLLAGLAAPPRSGAEPVLYITSQSFIWREFGEGARLLKESGLLFGAGISYPIDFENRVIFVPRAELFGGSVDYEGRAYDNLGKWEAANTTVDYFGLKLEADLSRSFLSSRESFLEPFGGLGLRFWSRDLNSGTTATGQATSGYVEEWIILYLRAGARAGILLSGKKVLFLQAGAIIPSYVENTAYVSSIGKGPDIRMHPGKQVSFFGEAGIQAQRFTGSLFYDSLRFPESPVEFNGITTGYQPRSTMDVYGLKVGWGF